MTCSFKVRGIHSMIYRDWLDPKGFYYKAVKTHLWFSGSRKQLKQNYRDQT